MSMTATPRLLSGSTDGLPIIVAGTNSGTATTIHTAVALATGNEVDEVYMTVANVTANPELLTIEWGSTADPGGHAVHQLSIPANSPQVEIATGQRITNAKVIKAFCPTANALNIMGGVIRYQ